MTKKEFYQRHIDELKQRIWLFEVDMEICNVHIRDAKDPEYSNAIKMAGEIKLQITDFKERIAVVKEMIGQKDSIEIKES